MLGIEPSLLLTQAIGFIITVALLWKFGFKPINGILEQRQADIKATYDQLDADRDEMIKTRREYEQRLAGIEAEARERIQAAVKEAQTLRDQMLADAHKQAEAIIERSRTDSQREREKVFLDMRQQIVSLSLAAAGKVIGESLDTPRQIKLVDDFIALAGSGGSAKTGIGKNGNGTGSQKGAPLS